MNDSAAIGPTVLIAHPDIARNTIDVVSETLAPKPSSTPKEFLAEFRHWSEELGREFGRASRLGSGTAQEVADHREAAFRALIERFYPRPKIVTKGQILPVSGPKSNSIDCIVLNEAHPNLVDAGGKFSMILADGVDFAVEVKGRLDGAELDRCLKQGLSVSRARCSRTPIVPMVTKQARDFGVARSTVVPFYSYWHEQALSVETMCHRIRDWVLTDQIDPLDRPIAYAIHDRGVLVDTTAPHSLSMYLEPFFGAGLVWIERGDLTLGLFLVFLDRGMNAVLPDTASVFQRYVNGGDLIAGRHPVLRY